MQTRTQLLKMFQTDRYEELPWWKIVYRRLISVVVMISYCASLAVPLAAPINAQAAVNEMPWGLDQFRDPQAFAHPAGTEDYTDRNVIWGPYPIWHVLATMDQRTKTWKPPQGVPNEPEWIKRQDYLGKVFGLTENKMASLYQYIPASNPSNYMFGRYDPASGQLRVTLVRLRKLRTTGEVRMEMRLFSPWEGLFWVAGLGSFRPPNTPHYQYSANPFLGMGNPAIDDGSINAHNAIITKAWNRNPALNNDPFTDPVFYNVASPAVAMAVMGLLSNGQMDQSTTLLAVLSVVHNDIQQSVSSSGNFWSQTISRTVTAYTGSDWYVGFPRGLNPNFSFRPAYCIGAYTQVVNGQVACNPTYQVTSSLFWQNWTGGNLPAAKDLVYQHTDSQSSFSLGFFSVLVAVLVTVATYGAGAALVAAEAGSAVYLSDALAYGVIAGGVYAAGTILAAGGGSITDAQGNIFAPLGKGTELPPAATSQMMADINAAVTQAVMTVDQTNSTTANRQIYNGNCPTNYTVAQCRAQGLDPGQLPRPDNWNQTDMRPFFRARVQPCQAYYANQGQHAIDMCIIHTAPDVDLPRNPNYRIPFSLPSDYAN